MMRTIMRAAVAVGLAALLMAAPGIAAAAECANVEGTFNLQEVRDPALCSSPIGRCWQGSLSGDLAGTYDFIFTSLTAADPNDPNLFNYTGTSVITLEQSSQPQLFTQDSGFLRLNPLGPTPFQATATIVGGTRRYRHASGQLVLVGGLDELTGLVIGTYTGQVCR
jgi:hypothetical protein